MSIFHLRYDSLDFTKHGRITGEIYASMDDVDFPEAGWNDFVDVLLMWWSEELLNNANPHFQFMDGPYHIEFHDVGKEGYEMRFISSRKDPATEILKARVEKLQIFHDLHRMSKDLLRYCHEHNVSSEEVNKIREYSQQLARIRRSINVHD